MTLQEKFDCLSVRERETFTLICFGLLNKEIADKMKCTTKTVEKHRQHIYTKLDVCSPMDTLRVGLLIGHINIVDWTNHPIRPAKHKKQRTEIIKTPDFHYSPLKNL